MSTRIDNTAKWPDIIFLSFVYALYMIVLTAPIGFVISAIKVYRFKRMAETSSRSMDHEAVLIATHYEWLVRTFIATVVMTMAAIGLAYYIAGFVIGGVAVAWWFYRIIRGAMALIFHHMMSATICTQALCYGQI